MKTKFYISTTKNTIMVKRSNLRIYSIVLVTFALLSANSLTFGQTTVYTTDFATAGSLTQGTPAITYVQGSANYTGSATPVLVTEVLGGNLSIYNSSTTSGINTRLWLSGNLSAFGSPFNSTLSSNVGDVTWYFNIQPGKSALNSGFGNTLNAVACVLAATSNDFTTANGYAVIITTGTSNNALRLVSFTNGLLSSGFSTICGPSADFTAFNNVQNVKVIYTPSTSTWKFYSYDTKQNSSTTSDPKAATFTQIGTSKVNNTYTSTQMLYFGFADNIASTTGKMKIDNFSVTIDCPTINAAPAIFNTFSTTLNTPVAQTISVSGTLLTNDITAVISGADASQFSALPATLTQSGGAVAATNVNVTYNPTVAGSHSATLTLSSVGANDAVFQLSGSTITGINELNNIDYKVNVVDNKLVMYSGEIYNSIGGKVVSIKESIEKSTISLRPGVYIVKTATNIQKVLIR